jgi:hypothetical protein
LLQEWYVGILQPNLTRKQGWYFPSVTAGWVSSDEGFFGESSLLISKIRSYGIVGNDAIPNNVYLSPTGEATYVFNGVLVNGRASGQFQPNLKWEEAKKFDVGLDMNLFDNNPSCDYFIDTTDLLIPVFQFQVYQEDRLQEHLIQL